jgi:hypothetical protein
MYISNPEPSSYIGWRHSFAIKPSHTPPSVQMIFFKTPRYLLPQNNARTTLTLRNDWARGGAAAALAYRHRRTPSSPHAHDTSLGHLWALRELGHCLQDGYGARHNDAAGRRLLLHAAAWEMLPSSIHGFNDVEDAANRFMVEWWARPVGKEEAPAAGGRNCGQDADLRLCSQVRCGR